MDNFKKPEHKNTYKNPATRIVTRNARLEAIDLENAKTKKSLSGLRKTGRAK